MFFRNFGVKFQHSIRRRIIVNQHSSCIKKQIRLTNLQYQVNKPSRFTYRIEYTTLNSKGGRNFIGHLIHQG